MTRQKSQISVLLVVGMACIAWCGADAAPVRLELKLGKGKTYYERTVIDQKITQTMMGQQQNFDLSMGAGEELDVLDVDPQGNMRIRHTYLWSRIKNTNPAAPLDYDSSRPTPVPTGAEGFAALIGEGFIMVLSPKGKVLALEGMKELRETVLKKLPPGSEGSPTIQALNPFFDERQIKQMTEASLAVYPDEPVEQGSSWTEKTLVTMGFPMVAEYKWTLQKREAGIATLAESSSFRSDPEGPPADMGSMKMKFEGSGTQDGTMQIEEATGLILSKKASQQIKGDIKIGASAEGPFDMAIPMTFETQIVSEMSDQMWKTSPQ